MVMWEVRMLEVLAGLLFGALLVACVYRIVLDLDEGVKQWKGEKDD